MRPAARCVLLLALAPAAALCVAARPRAVGGENAQPAPPLAIVGVSVADGTTPELRRAWTVVVRGGRIVAAGPSRDVRPPRGATVIDGAGKFLVPGLWDMHVHLNDKDAEWLPLLVAHGVTAARDVGALRAAEADSMRRLANGRGLPAPRILTAGIIVETASSLAFMERLATRAARTRHPTPRWARGHLAVTTPADAEAAADSAVRAGGRMLKFIDPGTPAVYDALARAARARGLTLVGHAPQALRTVGPWRALDAGQRSFEHAARLGEMLDTMPPASRAAFTARMREREAAFVPTLLVSSQGMIPTGQFRTLVDDSLGTTDRRNRWISAQERSQWAVRLDMLRDPAQPQTSPETWARIYARETDALRTLRGLGAPILPGTDLGMYLVYPGSSLHEELALLVRDVAMTPFEALRSATLASARWAGVADSVGSVRAGQAADLVLLDGDPLADVANLAKVRAVLVGGRVWDRAALDAMTAWRAR